MGRPHPGAMNFSHQNSVKDATDIGLGIIAPDGRDGMIMHAREFHEMGIPFSTLYTKITDLIALHCRLYRYDPSLL